MIASYNNLMEKVQRLDAEKEAAIADLDAVREELIASVNASKAADGYLFKYGSREFMVQKNLYYEFMVSEGNAVLLTNYRGGLDSIRLKIALGQI